MPNKIYLTVVLIIIAVAGLVVAAPVRVQGDVYHERIAHDDDDAQQNDAVMYLDDPMLDIGDIDEEMALRFINVTVPKGSIINNAYVEFTAYKVDRETKIPISIFPAKTWVMPWDLSSRIIISKIESQPTGLVQPLRGTICRTGQRTIPIGRRSSK